MVSKAYSFDSVHISVKAKSKASLIKKVNALIEKMGKANESKSIILSGIVIIRSES